MECPAHLTQQGRFGQGVIPLECPSEGLWVRVLRQQQTARAPWGHWFCYASEHVHVSDISFDFPPRFFFLSKF